MFEFDKYERAKHVKPPIVLPSALKRFSKPRRTAFLLWSEHCVECAAPACYTTCDLYVARSDGRCRRFPFGMYKNRTLVGNRFGGAEVVFGRWAKIEARGNAFMIATPWLSALETVAQFASHLLNGVGRLLAPLTKDSRWKYAAFAAIERFNASLRRAHSKNLPDGFLVDVYNPGSAPLTLSLSIAVDRSKVGSHLGPDKLPRPFLKSLTLLPGRYRELVPYADFRDIIESQLPFNLSLIPSEEGAHLVFMALDLVQFDRNDQPSQARPITAVPKAAKKDLPKAKCVIFDLDNTLWDGVLLETENVQLRRGLEALLRKLDERGILLSIASKNSHDHAIGKLKELGIEEFFLFPRINWGPKSENVKMIAKDLDIGIDTFLFVDDNPFELDEVARALPMVECIHVDQLDELLDHARLGGSTSLEARSRRRMYRESMVRGADQAIFGEDYLAFLRSCQIRLAIRPNQPTDLERIYELVQRTNQLNFSGRKYTRGEIDQVLRDASLEHYVMTCEDRYGSYGTVGFCMARVAAGTISVEDLMLSCRVQGKFIEAALFDFLCRKYDQGKTELRVNFRPTPRNIPAQQVLTKLGFDLSHEGYVIRNATAPKIQTDFIQIIGHNEPQTA